MAQSVRKQIEELRDEFEAWRRSHAAPAGAEVSAAGQPPDPGVHGQITELNRLVQVMLEEAEETAANHPVAKHCNNADFSVGRASRGVSAELSRAIAIGFDRSKFLV